MRTFVPLAVKVFGEIQLVVWIGRLLRQDFCRDGGIFYIQIPGVL